MVDIQHVVCACNDSEVSQLGRLSYIAEATKTQTLIDKLHFVCHFVDPKFGFSQVMIFAKLRQTDQ
jgi:hypothetical protein